MDLMSFMFLGLLKVNISYLVIIFLGFLILIDFVINIMDILKLEL